MRKYWAGASLAAIALVSATAIHAQETTATLRGDVAGDSNAPVANATVTITHTPSGTRQVIMTDADGTFTATGLRIGGPFDVSIAAPGFETATTTVPNLVASTPQRISVALASEGQVITVTGTRQRSSITLATGAATSLGRDDIEGIASVNRDIRDLARRDPLVTLDPLNRGISIAGQNGRFNKFSVDGVQFSDDFGINQGGLPTQRGPVPLDAICEFTVEVAPTDVTQGDFQGGAINTVLCSGTNDYHGSAFYTYSDDSLTGDRTRNVRTNLNFDSKNYGFSLKGPIVKDKLFLAVTGERLREGRGADYGITGEGFPNTVNVSRALVDQVKTDAKSIYNYDTLDIPSSVLEKDDKLVAKADWNITDDQRLSGTYVYNNSSNFQDSNTAGSISTTSPYIALQSNSYELTEKINSGVIQLNSKWSDAFSTEARVSYRDYKRGQIPYNGRDFGQFSVCTNPTSDSTSATTMPSGSGGGTTGCNTGVAQVRFGPDASRQANVLRTTNLDIQFQAELNSDGHNFKALFERNEIEVYNLFAQNVSGVFYFDSIADYEARRANQLVLNVPINGDINSVAARFKYQTWTLGLQDTWDATNSLTLQYGFRYDLYAQKDRPTTNQNFINRAETVNGSRINTNAENISGKYLFSPRIGVTWAPIDRLKFSGSAGKFGGGTPDVYLSNSFSNTGIVSNQASISRSATGVDSFGSIPVAIGQAALNNVGGGPAIPSVVTQYLQQNTASVPLSTVNALDPNFKIPSVWRLSGSLNYSADFGSFGSGWNFGADFIYTDVINGFQVTDARLVAVGTLPDGRPRYAAKTTAGDTNADYILYNSKRGNTKIAVARFDKDWDFGLSLGASYTYTRAKAVSELTSSTSSSLYNQTAASDPNFAVYGTSNDETRHQIKWNAGFRTKIFGDNETRFDIFGERRSGRHFSYTGEDSGTATRSALYGVLGDDRRFLLYVPTGPNDPLVEYAASGTGANAQTAAQTASILDGIINNSKLKNYRGQVAPKNLGTSPWFTKIDLRVSQQLPLLFGTKVKIFGDIENVLNLIDKDLGSYRVVGFPYFASTVQASCAAFAPAPNTGTCIRYRYTQAQNPQVAGQTRVSLYQIRVGAKFEF